MPRPPRHKKPGTQADDTALFAALDALVTAEKTLSTPIAWVRDDQGDFRFTRPLDIDGITQEGLFLFGRAVSILPDRDVTLGLRWADARARGGPFDRLDWKPIHIHNNKGLGPPALRHVLIEGTHRHPLADNAALAMGLTEAIRQNLPVAAPVEPEPGWRAFLAEAARCWNMPGLHDTPGPPWQYDLPTRPDTGTGEP